ncbi:hypothetical protein BDN67DRAFT_972589 [Paxillus ammoniavirescens]|nr:hypothetical protein BDN67DRAFT_972589 [Paxillus ammoniavirescens]
MLATPLWTLAVWQKCQRLVRSQSKWQNGESWLANKPKPGECAKIVIIMMAEAFYHLFAVFPWNFKLNGDAMLGQFLIPHSPQSQVSLPYPLLVVRGIKINDV